MKNNIFFKSFALFLILSVCLFNAPLFQTQAAESQSQKGSYSPYPATDAPPLTLEDCYRLALEESDAVAIQKEAIARANAQMFTAASQALGNVDFIVSRSLQENMESGNSAGGSLGSSFVDPDRTENKFTISQPLFQGFKAVGAITGAGSYKREQKELWLRSKELLYEDVARAFYGILRFQKEIRIIREIHKLLGERIKELEEREKIGRSRLSEIATATTGMKNLESNLAGAKGTLANYQYLLEFLIGMSIVDKKLQDDDDQAPSHRAMTDYLKIAYSRSDVQAAEQAVKTAWRGILVAQSGFWPTISLAHNQYMRREGFNASVDWDTLFKFDVPLFSGGATVGLVKESISILKQKKHLLSIAKRQADLQVKQSYEGWRYSKEQYLAFKEAVASAEENYKLQSDEYRRSLVSNLDVLTALQSLSQAQQNANQAFYQMKQDEARLKVAIGEVS
ncbi:MAG TPA: TolC family protein [Candidatus Omnitrophota bacterium]|nr:TolC family protein [Candidatus Omnitrophota bacterium]